MKECSECAREGGGLLVAVGEDMSCQDSKGSGYLSVHPATKQTCCMNSVGVRFIGGDRQTQKSESVLPPSTYQISSRMLQRSLKISGYGVL